MKLAPPIAPVQPGKASEYGRSVLDQGISCDSSKGREKFWIAIAGNPNCGKSTLFNALTGLSQKVGNYPGVTVEKKTGRCRGGHGEAFEMLDLPGIYSLQAHSVDEMVARDVLLGRGIDTPAPDVIVCVVDATNLERGLYLLAQIAELKIPMVVALNMVDMAERDGTVINTRDLARRLGCLVVPTVAAKRKGIVELRQAITRQLDGAGPHAPVLPGSLENAAVWLADVLVTEHSVPARFARTEALLRISTSQPGDSDDSNHRVAKAVQEARQRVARSGLDACSAAFGARHAWAQEIAAAVVRGPGRAGATFSDGIDHWVTHRLWGWLFFLGIMSGMFCAMFYLAEIPKGWIETGQQALSAWVTSTVPAGQFQDLLVNGVLAGVGGVVMFLPQILILFFFIGLLEDTGYLARAALIMDRFMSRAGLPGKAFVPMLSSFACAIPGVMATRTIETAKDRLATILVAPLMSCSARLPVYGLMISVLMTTGFSAWHKAGLMVVMYLLGVVAAFGMACLFRRTLFRGQQSLLLLELPPYRWPSLRVMLHRMWERACMFLRRAGTVILAVSVIIWALSSYPRPEEPSATPAEALRTSAVGRLGHAIEPVIKPLGFDWKIGVGMITSFAAREMFVTTTSIVHSLASEDDAATLSQAMLADKRSDGSTLYSGPVCLGVMVYYVLAMQCISTIVVVRRETNSWKWPLFQVVYMTALAWLAAFIVFQVGRVLGYA